MKPNAPTYSTNGNMVGEDIDLSVDQSSLVHLMSILTKAYSDPVLAVIREYSTNAADSHIEAGNTDAIRVVLPTNMSPTFIVQDFGVGLSVDDIRNIYSKYGASTKRDSDAATGTLGIGCKSALAYTEQFTVEGVKGGVKTTVVVTRNERGGTMKVVDTRSTDEPNGVIIKVPVGDVDEFRRKANEYFRFWRFPVDGIDIELPSGVWLDDDTLLTKHLGTDYIVMGNVPYRNDAWGHNLSYELPSGWNVIHWAPMGAVTFPPSREELEYSAKTKAYIHSIRSGLVDRVKAKVQTAIDDAKTKADAFKVALDYYGLIRYQEFTFKGERIPTVFKVSGWEYGRAIRRRGRGTASVLADISFQSIDEYNLYVHGFQLQSLSKAHRDKLDKYCEDNDIDDNRIAIVDVPFWQGWFEPENVIDWDTISNIKLPRQASTRSAAGTYDVYNGDWEREVDGDDIDYPVVFWTQADVKKDYWDRKGWLNVADAHKLTGLPVILMGANRWDKFKREHEDAMSLKEWIDAELTKLDEQATPADLLAGHHSTGVSALVGLEPDKVDDPDLADAINMARESKVSTYRERRQKLISWHRNVSDEMYYSGPPMPELETDAVEIILDRYPFLVYNGNVKAEHTYEYVNGVYNATV